MEQILKRILLLGGKDGESISKASISLIQGRWQGYVILAKTGIKIHIDDSLARPGLPD